MKTLRRSPTVWRVACLKGLAVAVVAASLSGCAERDLFEAAADGREREIHARLDADPGALHARDSVGRTALHRAAESGAPAAVVALLDAGADPFALDRLGFTPLDYARFSRNEGVVEIFTKRMSLLEAVRRGEPELVSKVLSDDPEAVDRSGAGGLAPLHLALDQPSPAMLEQLLREGADPNTPLPTGESPLQRVVERRDRAMVRLLIDAGADLDRLDPRGRSPLYSAVGVGDLEIIALLLERGANPNLEFAEGLTPLQIAAQKGRIETVQLLLSKGARPDGRNQDGRDGLYWARKHRHYSLASILETHLRGDDD